MVNCFTLLKLVESSIYQKKISCGLIAKEEKDKYSTHK
jgi:hypothetical protein